MERAFHLQVGKNQEWLTPPSIISALGEFDLDPCAVHGRLWDTAKNHFTIHDDGLKLDWFGRVWLNPPFDRNQIEQWMRKMSSHNNGVCLVMAKTETKWFQRDVFPVADSILFMDKRFNFLYRDGRFASANCGAPPVLIGYGEQNSEAIAQSGIGGKHLPLNRSVVVVVGISPSWYSVVSMAVRNGVESDLQALYSYVESLAPDKVAKNNHWKEKVRQQLYRLKRSNLN